MKQEKDNYFGENEEAAIKRFQAATTDNERETIWTVELHEPFNKLSECTLSYLWSKLTALYTEYSYAELKQILISHVYSKIDKFDTTKGKAFSYFNRIMVNFLLIENRKTTAKRKFLQTLEVEKDNENTLTWDEVMSFEKWTDTESVENFKAARYGLYEYLKNYNYDKEEKYHMAAKELIDDIFSGKLEFLTSKDEDRKLRHIKTIAFEFIKQISKTALAHYFNNGEFPKEKIVYITRELKVNFPKKHTEKHVNATSNMKEYYRQWRKKNRLRIARQNFNARQKRNAKNMEIINNLK